MAIDEVLVKLIVRRNTVGQGRIDIARTDRVDADSPGAKLRTHVAGDLQDGAFAVGIAVEAIGQLDDGLVVDFAVLGDA